MNIAAPYTRSYSYSRNYRNATGVLDVSELPDYSAWNCDQWVEFFKRLKSRYGKEHAVIIWQEYWNNKDVSVFNNQKVCSGQLDFRNYFSGQGIDFAENFYSVKAKIPGLLNKYTNILIVVGVVGGVALSSFIIFNIIRTVRDGKTKVQFIKDNPEVIKAVL